MQNQIEDANLRRAQIAQATADSDAQRQDALKRAVARQRAKSGASGITQSGSTEAVLLGMFTESEDQRAERERLDQLRYSAIDQDLAQQNRLNVLQQTQLRQRQNLNASSNALGSVNSFLGSLF